jgi:hypothetical protein
VGDAAPPLACCRCSLTSAMARKRALWSGDREAEVVAFHRPPAGVQLAPVMARQRRGIGHFRVLLTWPGCTAVASATVSLVLLKSGSQGVRRNARMKFKLEFLKFSTVGCQGNQ